LGPQIRDWLLMRIETDEGIQGLGEWSRHASASRFNTVRRLHVGQDPMQISALHHSSQPQPGLWHLGGIGAGAGIALRDIIRKRQGVPLRQLMGGQAPRSDSHVL
jgi:L-alanine-DL-glutamate epimerase-like enolase superfamily enzyme